MKALDHLDEIIQLIRAADSPATAKQGLISRFEFSEVQAQAILDMRLQRLTGLERQKIIDEAREVEAAIARFRQILSDEAQVRALVFAVPDEVRGSAGTVTQLARAGNLPHQMSVVSGVREAEARRLAEEAAAPS